MYLLPKFEIYDQNKKQLGMFKFGETDLEVDELFMEAEDLYHEYEYRKSKKLLEKIIKRDPSYDEAYILLSDIEIESTDLNAAEKILNKGIDFFKSIIPAGYDGEIPWIFEENKPYLRLIHKLLLLYDQNGKTNQAIETGNQILYYNPDDNLGIRWLMGDLYLKNGNLNEAEKFLKKNADQYPPLRYSYALLLMKQNKRWDAITQFRFGFLENIYVSEILKFKAPLTRYAVFEPSNLNGLETASDYAQSMTEFWLQHTDVLQIMEILTKHPIIYGEINRVYGLFEELYTFSYDNGFLDSFEDSEFDLDVKELHNDLRKEIFEEIDSIKAGINKASSKAILQDLDNIFKDI